MQNERGERLYQFEKHKILARLMENKKLHREKVEKAWDKYQELVVQELERRLSQAKSGQPVDPAFLQHLPIPQDFTKSYERVIDRLELQLGTEVELTENEFNMWMRDEWNWTTAFMTSNARYLGGAAGAAPGASAYDE